LKCLFWLYADWFSQNNLTLPVMLIENLQDFLSSIGVLYFGFSIDSKEKNRIAARQNLDTFSKLANSGEQNGIFSLNADDREDLMF